MSKTNRLLVMTNLLLVTLLILGIGQTAIVIANASNSSIHACASKSTGSLRLANSCKSSERHVSWSIQGPQGSTGAQGPQGNTGAQGPMGPRGLQGNSADLTTKTVTIRYTGDADSFLECGDGNSSFNSYKLYDSILFNAANLSSSLNWTSVSGCYITLKVLQ